MRFSQHLKKVLIVSGVVVPLFFLNVANLRAATSTGPDYLQIIANNTTAILQKVNGLPDYLTAMGAFILNMQAKDNSDSMAKMQANFDLLGQVLVQNPITQASLQKQLTSDIVGKPLTDFNGDQNAPILTSIPNINDLSYASLLGYPPAAKGAFSPYNYIKYASGANINHVVPMPKWGDPRSLNIYQPAYAQYYNTLTAIESFGAYVLTNQLVEAQNANQSSSALQDALVAQAGNATWLKEIGGEEIGKVLREILVFQSQSYVLLTQLVQTQKQLLTATIMSNTLMIQSNRQNESYLAAKAQGVTPSA